MKLSFWIQFAIQEAMTVSEMLVSMSGLNPAQKAALEAFILAGNKVVASFTQPAALV